MSSITYSWPASLPLPLEMFEGATEHRTLCSPLSAPIIYRRSRGSSAQASITARWVFTIEQYDTFLSFFEDDLGEGAALFVMEIRYPKSSELTNWVVRFTEGLECVPLGRLWSVSASLTLVREDFVLPTQWSPFLVVQGGGYESFVVSPNSPFYIKEL
jgi:hypothetical protein